jgi:hypothetical protein
MPPRFTPGGGDDGAGDAGAPAGQEPTGVNAGAGSAGDPNAPTTGTGGEPQLSEFLSQVQQLGFEGVTDEAEARRRLVEAYRLREEQYQYAQQQAAHLEQYARQYAQLQQDPRWQAFQQQFAAPPQQPAEPQGWWQAPQVDLTLLDQYREEVVGEDGKATWRWKADAPADYKQRVQEYQHYLDDWRTKLITRPHEVLPQIIEQEASRLFEQKWQERQHQLQAQTFAQEVQQRNQDWLYARDPVSNRPLVDPTGNPVLSVEGQRVNHYIAEAARMGIMDPQARWSYATQSLELELRRQAPAVSPQAAAAAVNQQQKIEHLQQAARAAGQPNGVGAASAVANRGASVPPTHEPGRKAQNRRLSAGDKLRQAFQAQGADVVAPTFKP